MNFPNKARQTKGLAGFLAIAACVGVAGCAMSPFGNELTANTASQPTGAPMPIEATYTQTLPASATATPPPKIAAAPVPAAMTTAGPAPASASGSTLLSPEEKEKVIAELEALAKKQGTELSAERAKAQAACDNLSADELRKKMLQGEC